MTHLGIHIVSLYSLSYAQLNQGWIALPEATASTVLHNLLLLLQWSRAMHSRCFCRCLSLPWNEVGRPSCTFQFYHLQGHTWSYNTLFPLQQLEIIFFYYHLSYLSRLSLSGFACLSSGSLYTMGTPGADGDSAKITLSPEQWTRRKEFIVYLYHIGHY